MSNDDASERTYCVRGWIRDVPDPKDITFGLPNEKLVKLPSSVDLRPRFPFPVYNQFGIGSCTSNAACGAFRFELARQNLPDHDPSRLFVYWNSRDNQDKDEGAQVREACKIIRNMGACEEKLWSYEATEPDSKTQIWAAGAKPSQRPSDEAYKNALEHRAKWFQKIQDHDVKVLKACLNEGKPFVFGFNFYTPSMSQENLTPYGIKFFHDGILGPPPDDEVTNSGHAVLAVGYDDDRNAFLVRNSWGLTGWENSGHFWMDYRWFDEQSPTYGPHADNFTVMHMEAKPIEA